MGGLAGPLGELPLSSLCCDSYWPGASIAAHPFPKAIVAKLSSPKTSLAMTLAKPELILMQVPQKQIAENLCKKIEDIETTCKAVIADANKPLPEGITKAQDRSCDDLAECRSR